MSNRSIKDIELLDILPENLRDDPDIIAASKAVDSSFLKLVDEAENVIIIPRIDGVSEDILDHLAYYFSVDFYDISMDVEVKRELVKESMYIHKVKGTPLAVEKLINTLFGDGEVSEWFDYGDTPFRFRVLTGNPSATTDRAEEFFEAVETVKNIRSVLDKVILLQREELSLFFGGIVHQGSIEIYRSR